MVNFIFWNLNRKPLTESIVKLARIHGADYLLFAESPYSDAELLNMLNEPGSADFFYLPTGECQKIQIYSRIPPEQHRIILESNRLTIREAALLGRQPFLFATTHFPSKLHWSKNSQAFECSELSTRIKKAEEIAGHSRTILVGDLNMNPFEDGMIGAPGLHAVMSQKIASRDYRIVNAEKYPFFYNPMWNLMGDYTPGPPGTYYYNSSEHVSFFWNMFDQVLIRPDLVGQFDINALSIIETDGITSFLDENGIPDTQKTSDHLPIFFAANPKEVI